MDSGNEIILANWPTEKHIICLIYNYILIEIPSHPYVLVNRSVLCNCGIEAENNYILESLAACHDSNSKFVMFFTVNNAFTNYLNELNPTEDVEIQIFTNKSTSEITLPIFLNRTKFDEYLLSAPLTLKEYIAQYKHDKEIFDLIKRHDIDELEKLEKEFANKNFFKSSSQNIQIHGSHNIDNSNSSNNRCDMQTQQIKSISNKFSTPTGKRSESGRNGSCRYKYKCTAQFYIILSLSIIMIGAIIFAILQLRRIKLCRGQLFLNIVKIMIFI